jgi:hypothetical protein
MRSIKDSTVKHKALLYYPRLVERLWEVEELRIKGFVQIADQMKLMFIRIKMVTLVITGVRLEISGFVSNVITVCTEIHCLIRDEIRDVIYLKA